MKQSKITIGYLNGPTGMGMAKLIADTPEDSEIHDFMIRPLLYEKSGCFYNPVGTAVSLTGTVVAHETYPSKPAPWLVRRDTAGPHPACHILSIQALLRLKQHRRESNP